MLGHLTRCDWRPGKDRSLVDYGNVPGLLAYFRTQNYALCVILSLFVPLPNVTASNNFLCFEIFICYFNWPLEDRWLNLTSWATDYKIKFGSKSAAEKSIIKTQIMNTKLKNVYCLVCKNNDYDSEQFTERQRTKIKYIIKYI